MAFLCLKISWQIVFKEILVMKSTDVSSENDLSDLEMPSPKETFLSCGRIILT